MPEEETVQDLMASLQQTFMAAEGKFQVACDSPGIPNLTWVLDMLIRHQQRLVQLQLQVITHECFIAAFREYIGEDEVFMSKVKEMLKNEEEKLGKKSSVILSGKKYES